MKSFKFNLNKTIVLQVMAIISLFLLLCIYAHAAPGDDGGATAAATPATVGGVRKHFAGVSDEVIKMIMLVAAVAGVGYVGMGLFSLKAASDSAGQQNQNLQKGIVKLILGGCLVSIPFLMNVSNSVVVEDQDSNFQIPTEHSAQEVSDSTNPPI
jgi:hypothetical protein